MTLTKDKFEEVHINFWDSHDPLILSGKTYSSILMCKKMQKI